MLRTWRRQPRPKQPTGCNPYPTRIGGCDRQSRAASGQSLTSSPVAFRGELGREYWERSQLKNSGQTPAHTRVTGLSFEFGISIDINSRRLEGASGFGRRPIVDGFSMSMEGISENSGEGDQSAYLCGAPRKRIPQARALCATADSRWSQETAL
jgi:hypothetical protein